MSENHNLAADFPEFQDAIHNLKLSNAHFRKLFDRFQDIDHALIRAEQRIDLISAVDEENLRKERLQVKDEIYKMLKLQNDK